MTDPGQIVTELMAAVFSRDFDAARVLIHPDIEFSLPGDRHFRGIEATLKGFEDILRPGIEFSLAVHHQVSDGQLVMNERHERFTWDGGDSELRIAGVFEVVDGLVRRWTDYNDR